MKFSAIITGVFVARFCYYLLYLLFAIVVVLLVVKDADSPANRPGPEENDHVFISRMLEKYSDALLICGFVLSFTAAFFGGGATASMARGSEMKNCFLLSFSALLFPGILLLSGHGTEADPYQQYTLWGFLAYGAGAFLGPYVAANLIMMAREEEETTRDAGVGLK